METMTCPKNRNCSQSRGGKFLLIYIWNFHVLSNLLLIYICKLHWNRWVECHRDLHSPGPSSASDTQGGGRPLSISSVPITKRAHHSSAQPTLQGLDQAVPQLYSQLEVDVLHSGKFLLICIWNFHVLCNLLLIYICKLHWNLNTMFVCQVNSFWFTYVISMFYVIYYWFTYVNSTGISIRCSYVR